MNKKEFIQSLSDYIIEYHDGVLENLKYMREFYDLNRVFRNFSSQNLYHLILDFGHYQGLYITQEKIFHIPYLLKQFIKYKGGEINSNEISDFYYDYPEIRGFIQSQRPKFFVERYGEKIGLYFMMNKFYSFKPENMVSQKVVEVSWKKKRKASWYDLPQAAYQIGTKPPGSSYLFSRFTKSLDKYEIPKIFLGYLRKYPDNLVPKLLQKHARNLLSRKSDYSLFKIKDEKSFIVRDLKKFFELQEELLFVEEVQMLFDMNAYDIENGVLTKDRNSLYRLNVPGLAEKRPSVLRKDNIILKKEDFLVKAPVWFVNLDHILISLPSSMTAPSYNFKVHFEFNRTPLRLMHRALDDCLKKDTIKNVLKISSNTANSTCIPSYVNHATNGSTALNQNQKSALNMILNQPEYGDKEPIVIFGPPGTGKTVTIVETILKILQIKPQARILACAPSNDAADLICLRILDLILANSITKEIKSLQITRLLAMMRDPKLVPEKIKQYCNVKHENGAFVLPNSKDILSSKLIVATASSAGYLVSMELAEKFTHIILDEAGEAMIPEIMIPISLKSKNTSIILAGDPKQLGPLIRSQVAIEYGFEISLIERLIRGRLDLLGLKNPSLKDMENMKIIHLVENYRAHKSIMEIYSEIFYENKLISKATNASHRFLGWSELKNPNIPVLFRHVEGIEARDNDSPSWYNQKEIDEVKRLTIDLLGKRFATSKEIGIITPYRKQQEKIKQMLCRLSTDDHYHFEYQQIKVGTTELFQGDEREVIIMTCVRSQIINLEHDVKFNLGFTNNPKRINVAISRAKSLLVILGNANLLSTDENFDKILKKITSMNCYDGPIIKIPNIIRPRVKNLEENENDEGEDREWRVTDAL